jgi:hypothetical protein
MYLVTSYAKLELALRLLRLSADEALQTLIMILVPRIVCRNGELLLIHRLIQR